MGEDCNPLRIGIWFQTNHTPFGGPALVLAGTILGLYKYAAESGLSIILLLNEQGDVNWALTLTEESESNEYKMAPWIGPACFNRADACATPGMSETWRHVKRALFPSTWFAEFVSLGLPYTAGLEDHKYAVWPSGVDTDYFTPSTSANKTQDYFIYYKSQRTKDLHAVQTYLFQHWFGIRGYVMTYYNYDAEMLRAAAQASKFCIILDDTETQGLAALEIMACDCPLLVLDTTTCKEGSAEYGEATSVVNMDGRCGIKSRLQDIATEFPRFIAGLSEYTPRLFVMEDYSFTAAARRLLEILITGIHHQTQHN